MDEPELADGGQGAPSDAERALQAAVFLRLRDLRAGLGPHLGAAMDGLAARTRIFLDPNPGYFLHPLALPVLQLPGWVCGDALGPGVALDLAEAAATGYLHVRVQDDLLDEGVGEPGSAMMLAEVLLHHHQRLLTRHAPDRFWPLYEALWRSYAEAMLYEAALHREGGVQTAAQFDQVLDRSRPLALPAAAGLMSLGADAERIAALEAWVGAVVRAHQLYTDLLDAEKDLRTGNPTWVIRRLLGQGEATAARISELRRALMVDGGFDAIIGEVCAELDRADTAAEALGAPEAAGFVASRRAHVERVARRTWRTLFERLLAR